MGDHSVRAYNPLGSTLMLMRLCGAVAELAGIEAPVARGPLAALQEGWLGRSTTVSSRAAIG